MRGLPASTPTSAMHAITPARRTDGSAPVRIVKNATAPKPTTNFGHRERRSSAAAARTGASTIATFPPETTRRWLRPAARKSRSSPGSSCESSPSRSPRSSPASLEGNTRSIERPTTLRAPCVARTNALGDGPTRVSVCSWSCAGMPLWRSASANSWSSGTRSTPSSRTRSPRRARWQRRRSRSPRRTSGARRRPPATPPGSPAPSPTTRAWSAEDRS